MLRFSLCALGACCAVSTTTTTTTETSTRRTSSGLVDEPIASAPIQYLDGSNWLLSNGTLEVAATVPGDLLTDLQRAGIIGDPLYGDALQAPMIAAISGQTWEWSITFDLSLDFAALPPSTPVLLVADSVKLAADVSLNGAPLLSVSDQFLRYNVTVPSGLLTPTGNVLRVSSPPQSDPRNAAGRYMACSAGWDWAPTSSWGVFTRGIVRSVYLVAVPTAAIAHVVPLVYYGGAYPAAPLTDATAGPWTVAVRTHLLNAAAAGSVSGTVSVRGSWPGAAEASAPVTVPAGGEQAVTVNLTAAAGSGLALWWPVGLGGQPLYTVTATFTPGAAPGAAVPVSASRRIGFRVFTLVTDDDADPAALAALDGSGNLTMRFRVNGASLWSRGANMIPMEMLDGRASVAALEALVASAADGRMNTLRVWGGGEFLPDAFYDAADARGVLLYQDAMYAQQGHAPAATAQQEAELRHQVRRLSAHPSVALYDACNECGGAGIYASFVMTTIVSEDPSRPPWPSCPSGGWAAGVNRLWSLPSGAPLVPRAGAGVAAAADGSLTGAAAAAAANCTFLYNIDIDHGSLGPNPPAATPPECCALCQANATCWSATWYQGACWMKGPSNATSVFAGAVSCWPPGHPLPPLPSPGPAPPPPAPPRTGTIETHGPYIEGSGFDTMDTKQPLSPHDPDIPPALQFVATGPAYAGVYASEFGCSVFSSFESMSPSVPDWTVHGAVSWYWRNWPCDSGIVSYFGPQDFNASAGAATLQRQLYLCALAQALEMKSNIEARRSGNAWGTVVWQLNEVWPTGGWGSLEYGTVGWTPGQVLGGRWKPLHYWYRAFLFADLGLSCGSAGQCYVKNDGSAPAAGVLRTSLLKLEGQGTEVAVLSQRLNVSAGAGAMQWLCVDGAPWPCTGYSPALAAAGCATDGSDCLLLMQAVDVATGAVLAASHELLAPPSALVLPAATVTAAVAAAPGGGARVDVTSSAVALYVTLTTGAQGRFSDNAFIMAGGAASVNFTFSGDADVALLAATLRVEHVQMYR